jgi:Terminase large subunit, T4likevirus-type, N-terminal
VRHEARPDALRVHLHPKQWVAFLTEATEVLFGGAAGPGKSFLMRVAAIIWCSAIPGLQVYLFRRVREDLYKNHAEGPKGFRNLLAPWIFGGWCRIVGDEIRFWNGSVIYLCHCKAESDIIKYQGAEIHVLLIDELTHFTEAMYRYLRGRVRMVGIKLPKEYEGKFPRILCGSNPGGKGHLWVKTTFITGSDPLQIRRMPKSEGGMLRQFIPGRLEDNPSMAQDDPDYEAKLQGLGSATLVAALRYGDWDVIEGAFFDCWNIGRHVIRPFEVPKDWLRFRSGDWGSAKPFSFGWWAVVADSYKTETVTLPRGCLVRYREWYGMQPGKPNVGLKMHAEAVGAGLLEREKGDPEISYGVLDPSAFAQDGGPSIHERMFNGSGKKILFRPADNSRVPGRGAMGGWDQMRARMVGDEDGRPMIVCFSTCTDSIRTIPALQHDPMKPEDLDSDMEDHDADDWRYACMSRPWNRELHKPLPIRGTAEMTLNEAFTLTAPKPGGGRI